MTEDDFSDYIRCGYCGKIIEEEAKMRYRKGTFFCSQTHYFLAKQDEMIVEANLNENGII